MEDRRAREIAEKQFFGKRILVFFFAFRVSEIVVSIFWMEASVSVEFGMD